MSPLETVVPVQILTIRQWLNRAILLGALLIWLSAHHTQVFLDILALVPIWTPMLEQLSEGGGGVYYGENTPNGWTGTHKNSFSPYK